MISAYIGSRFKLQATQIDQVLSIHSEHIEIM